jgi:hypothetical protein
MLSEQNSHRERLDNKVAALIAASAGALYFFTDKSSSIPDTIIGSLFAIPLLLSLWAFALRDTRQASGPSLINFLPRKYVRMHSSEPVAFAKIANADEHGCNSSAILSGERRRFHHEGPQNLLTAVAFVRS